jgi:hypothetical protein
MKQSLLQEKYPVYTLELEKSETEYLNTDEIMDYLKTCINNHKVTCYIGEFDHYAHTTSLEEGSIQEGIIAAKNIVFCFGIALPKPEMLAVRPRSIGVAEYADRFVVSFLEAPMPMANDTMEKWAKAIVKPEVAKKRFTND